MGKLRVIFVHGISNSVIKGDYSAPLRTGICKKLAELGVVAPDASEHDLDEVITFHQANYSDIGHEAEIQVLDAYTEQRDNIYGFMRNFRQITGLDALRREILTAFCDVLVYKSVHWSRQIRDMVLQQIKPFVHTGDAVTLIGHSLGSVVAFDTIYYNVHDNPEWQEAGFKPSNLFTMGSPIAIFSLDVDRDSALQTSKYHTGDTYFPLLRPGGVWYNILDLQDVIAYPLEVLFEGKFVVEDIVVQTGISPRKAHAGYWDDEEVAHVIGQRLKKDYDRMHSAETEQAQEASANQLTDTIIIAE